MLKTKFSSTKLDPDYKKRFKERLKELHVQNGSNSNGSSTSSSSNCSSSSTSSSSSSSTSSGGGGLITIGNLVRSTVSKSCDNHINDHSHVGCSPNGRRDYLNRNNTSNNDDDDDEIDAGMSNSLNTLLNGDDTIATSPNATVNRSIEFMNMCDSDEQNVIYDNNGILNTDETGL